MADGNPAADDLAPDLDGLDGARPLPEALADRLRGGLGEPSLLGVDAPRPLPEPLRASLEAALAAAAPPGRAWVAWARRLPPRRRLAAAAAVVALLLGGVALAADDEDDAPIAAGAAPPTTKPRPVRPSTTTTTSAPPVLPAPVVEPPPEPRPLVEGEPQYARLGSFADCDQLLASVREQAVAEMRPDGLPIVSGGGRSRYAAAALPILEAPPGHIAARPASGDGESSTNVQETGVDEPDLIEVGDAALFVLTGDSVHAVLTAGGGASPGGIAVVADRSASQFPRGMFLDGATLLVLVGAYDEGGPSTIIRRLDVSDPTALVEVASTVVDGSFVDARLTGGRLHLVTSWRPGPFDFVHPYQEGFDEATALAHNQQAVAGSGIEQWVPPSLGCTDVQAPRDLAGFSTTIVTSVRPDDLDARTATGLLADPGLIYATGRSLVLTTTRWFATHPIEDPTPPAVYTSLHRFSLLDGAAAYQASGVVPGYLFDSYALDEDPAGNLRVAATTRRPFWTTIEATGAVTVTVLAQQGDVLVPIGAVEGLGAPNEQIEGVRFTDDLGFVVTFRRTDPLYVIDLSRPDQPRLSGALEVTGYSAYLQVLESGWLLGAGIEADAAGGFIGGSLSLYDIEYLDQPRLSHRATIPGTSFLVDGDPHAILLSESTGLVVLPGIRYQPGSAGAEAEFDVFVVSDTGIVEVARLDHLAHHQGPLYDQAYRAALIDGVLYTVAGSGVLATDTATWAATGWVPLPLGDPIYTYPPAQG